MKIIAFKRSNHPSLHQEFITEYIEASLLHSTEGYETMIEEHFLLELAKNPERQESHLKFLREQEQLAMKAKQDSEVAELKLEKEMDREFARFKAYQNSKGKK